MKGSKEHVLGVVRHALTWAGGWLVSSGMLTEASFTTLSGWILAVVGVALSITNKVKVKKLIDGYEITISEAKVKGKVIDENQA